MHDQVARMVRHILHTEHPSIATGLAGAPSHTASVSATAANSHTINAATPAPPSALRTQSQGAKKTARFADAADREQRSRSANAASSTAAASSGTKMLARRLAIRQLGEACWTCGLDGHDSSVCTAAPKHSFLNGVIAAGSTPVAPQHGSKQNPIHIDDDDDDAEIDVADDTTETNNFSANRASWRDTNTGEDLMSLMTTAAIDLAVGAFTDEFNYDVSKHDPEAFRRLQEAVTAAVPLLWQQYEVTIHVHQLAGGQDLDYRVNRRTLWSITRHLTKQPLESVFAPFPPKVDASPSQGNAGADATTPDKAASPGDAEEPPTVAKIPPPPAPNPQRAASAPRRQPAPRQHSTTQSDQPAPRQPSRATSAWRTAPMPADSDDTQSPAPTSPTDQPTIAEVAASQSRGPSSQGTIPECKRIAVIDRLRQDNKALERRASRLDDLVTELHAKVSTTRAKADRAEQDLNETRSELQAMREAASQARRELSTAQVSNGNRELDSTSDAHKTVAERDRLRIRLEESEAALLAQQKASQHASDTLRRDLTEARAERNSAVEELTKSRRSVTTLESEMQKLRSELDSAKLATDTRLSDLSGARSERDSALAEAAKARKATNSLESDVQKLRLELGGAKHMADTLRGDLSAMATERDATLMDATKAKKTANSLESEVQKLRSDLDSAKHATATLRGDLTEARMERDIAQAEVSKSKTAASSSATALAKSNTELERANARIQALSSARDTTATERTSVTKERDAAVSERDSAIKQRDAAVREREVAIADRDTAQERARRATTDYDNTRTALADLQTQIKQHFVAKELLRSAETTIAELSQRADAQSAAYATLQTTTVERDTLLRWRNEVEPKLDDLRQRWKDSHAESQRLAADNAQLRVALETEKARADSKTKEAAFVGTTLADQTKLSGTQLAAAADAMVTSLRASSTAHETHMAELYKVTTESHRHTAALQVAVLSERVCAAQAHSINTIESQAIAAQRLRLQAAADHTAMREQAVSASEQALTSTRAAICQRVSNELVAAQRQYAGDLILARNRGDQAIGDRMRMLTDILAAAHQEYLRLEAALAQGLRPGRRTLQEWQDFLHATWQEREYLIQWMTERMRQGIPADSIAPADVIARVQSDNPALLRIGSPLHPYAITDKPRVTVEEVFDDDDDDLAQVAPGAVPALRQRFLAIAAPTLRPAICAPPPPTASSKS